MATTTIDTLGYAKRLRAAGVPEQQAEAHAQALREMSEGNLATTLEIEPIRRDMAALRLEPRRGIEALRQEASSRVAMLRREVLTGLGGRVAVGLPVLAAMIGNVIARLTLA